MHHYTLQMKRSAAFESSEKYFGYVESCDNEFETEAYHLHCAYGLPGNDRGSFIRGFRHAYYRFVERSQTHGTKICSMSQRPKNDVSQGNMRKCISQERLPHMVSKVPEFPQGSPPVKKRLTKAHPETIDCGPDQGRSAFYAASVVAPR